MIRNPKWHSLFRVKDSPILYENIDPIGKEFDTYKVGTTANSCSTMHKIMSKPITLESFEVDDYNEDTCIERVDQSVLTTYGKQVDFISHWHVGEMADYIVEHCEDMRQYYIKLQEQMKVAEDAGEHKRLEYESYCVWKELIRWLPEGWLQKRTVTMTYENLHAMCSKSQRYFHKLNEWSGRRDSELENFIEWVRKEIPYAEDFILYHETEDEIKKHNEEVDKCSIFLWGLYSGNPTLFAPPEDNIFKQAVINLPWNYSSDTWMEGFKKMWDTYGEGLPEKGPTCSITDNKFYITNFFTFRKKNEEA